jgi:SAM-dependent methyltransferase
MISMELDPRSEYYSFFRAELLPYLSPARGRVILDVGCGAGHLLAHLKSQGARETIGLELRKEVADELRQSGRVDKVLCLDIETAELPLPEASLDLVIVSHVLEHMIDPWLVLRKLRRHLRPGGQLVGAIPNVRFVRVIWELVATGQWRYADSGILDRTHLRFFTKRSMTDLLTACGYQIDDIQPQIGSAKARWLERLSFGAASEFLGYAYNFKCHKPS